MVKKKKEKKTLLQEYKDEKPGGAHGRFPGKTISVHLTNSDQKHRVT